MGEALFRSQTSAFTREMGLPLRMENLHAPTVPSGPTSGPVANGTQSSGLTLAQLQAKKDNLEAEIRALGGVLDSHGVDMNTRLLTPDGFPRADLDVAQNSNNTSTHHLPQKRPQSSYEHHREAHPQTLRTSGREWTRGRAHDKWKQLDNGISISLRTTNTEPSFRQS